MYAKLQQSRKSSKEKDAPAPKEKSINFEKGKRTEGFAGNFSDAREENGKGESM